MVLSRASTRQLLAGKTIGLGLLGLGQLALFVLVGTAAVLATDIWDVPPGLPLAAAEILGSVVPLRPARHGRRGHRHPSGPGEG